MALIISEIHDADGGSLLMNAAQAARLFGKSERTWRMWDSAGWTPRPVRIGRSTFWRPAELREWAAAACPLRDAWEKRSAKGEVAGKLQKPAKQT